MSEKPKGDIAYICDGHDDCALEPGCFMRFDQVSATDVICRHTTNSDHAMYTRCSNPEEHPERFTVYRVGDEIKYYERLPGEEL